MFRFIKGQLITPEELKTQGYSIFELYAAESGVTQWVRSDHNRRVLVKDGVIIKILKNRNHLSGGNREFHFDNLRVVQ